MLGGIESIAEYYSKRLVPSRYYIDLPVIKSTKRLVTSAGKFLIRLFSPE